MKKVSLLLLVCILAFSACNKDDQYLSAVIIDGGDPALDGCGWLIEISTETFKPQNLTDEFKIDGLEVEIKYGKLSSKAGCGFASDVYFEIFIQEIRALTK